MIRAIILGALALACALVVSLFIAVPGFTAGLHPECNVTMPCAPVVSVKPTSSREARRIARADRFRNVEFGSPMYPPETAASFLAGTPRVLPHPEGCPRVLFCGCGAAVEVFGKPIRSLWLAAKWLDFPRADPAPGMVAARRGHVFVIKQVLGGGNVLAYDANSGGRRTRLHVRSLAGFVVVNPHG
jgi:hypothetical protein